LSGKTGFHFCGGFTAVGLSLNLRLNLRRHAFVDSMRTAMPVRDRPIADTGSSRQITLQ
jgi:hypothetical protein